MDRDLQYYYFSLLKAALYMTLSGFQELDSLPASFWAQSLYQFSGKVLFFFYYFIFFLRQASLSQPSPVAKFYYPLQFSSIQPTPSCIVSLLYSPGNFDPENYPETYKLMSILLISSKPIMRVRFQYNMEGEAKCHSKKIH